MTINPITISFKNTQRNIEFDRIPAVDAPMLGVLMEIHKKSPPPTSLVHLSERVRDLSKITKLLNHAKNHVLRDQILGVLATSFLAILVAGTTIGFIATPLIGVAIVLAPLCYMLGCHVSASALGQKDERKIRKYLTMYPMGVLLSPFILSYLLITRASRLQTKSNSYRNEIQSHAFTALEYWSLNGDQLAKKIVREKKRAQDSLIAMQKLPIRSPQGEKDLEGYMDLVTRTQTAIAKGQEMVKA